MTPENRRDLAIAKAEWQYRRRLGLANDEMRAAAIELDAALDAANKQWLQEIEPMRIDALGQRAPTDAE